MYKSVQKILLVVLRKTMPFIKKRGKHCRVQHNKSKFYFINDLQKTLDQRKIPRLFFSLSSHTRFSEKLQRKWTLNLSM